MDTDPKATPAVDYVAVLADMKKKRADLDKAIVGMEAMLGLMPSAGASAALSTPDETVSTPEYPCG